MDQDLATELVRELAVGFKAAQSYPVGHPVFEKAVAASLSVLNRAFTEHTQFTLFFSEGCVTFLNSEVDVGNNLALLSLLSSLRKRDIKSITFISTAKQNDLLNLYAVLASTPKQMEQDGGASRMLFQRGTESIAINATPTDATGTRKAEKGGTTHEEIIEAIRNLMEIVRARPAVSDARVPFNEVINDIESVSRDDWHSYSEAVAGVVELLPVEKRIALLQDVQMKSFTLTLLSGLSTETLVELIVNWERQGKRDHIVRAMGVIDKEKFGHIVPRLKNRHLNVYEYLTGAGINLLQEEDVASTIDEGDLKIALQPYYNMLETQNIDNRAEALGSLINFTKRLIAEQKYTMARGILLRIALAFEQESADEVIIRFMNDVADLYGLLRAHEQADACERLIEAFGRVLGRGVLSVALRKKIIEFLSSTGNPSVLPMLFSFLWESGLYPDVRTAIISFGDHAVNEAIQFLRDAEDFSVRMKLVDILKNIGEPSIKVLTNNLQAREWFLRRNIVRIFGDIGDTRVVIFLEPLLRDEDQRVRLELARTYGKLNHKEGLLKALNDLSNEVKGEALRGLKRMIDAEEVIGLLGRLRETGDEVYLELLKIIDEKRVFEGLSWIADLLMRLEWRHDTAADEIKELGINVLAKLDGDNAKMILLDLQKSKDKILSNLATATLKRIS